MNILFEDKNIIAVEKESGIPSQPDNTGIEDLKTILSKELNKDIYVVHRLDLQTSGIIVYAKNATAAGLLSESLRDSKKEYFAIIEGNLQSNGKMTDLLFHDKRINKSYVVNKERAGVKKALLEYEVIHNTEEKTLVKVLLLTGRTHQIRVQFASRGYPLLYDGKYGSHYKGNFKLHCYNLSFKHPITREIINLRCLPKSPWDGFQIKL